ncbi:hypothetical protein ACFQ1S_00160 [Kibdelosporangium lantanae]|uniref:Uncharacterized protein n=1 Tax=Kibdelosporangium lantanae TaxID=1497396 RepID=A0ABW3M0R2_9PSEU
MSVKTGQAHYMIRSGDVWVRRGRFVKPVSDDPATWLGDSTGLSGAHKKGLRTDRSTSYLMTPGT